MPSLFGLGSNGSGQLGLGHLDDVSFPTRSSLNVQGSRIVKISAGGNHTLVLTSDGLLYSAGDNLDGRCLREAVPSNDINLDFKRIDFQISPATNATFIACAATWEASLAVLSDGRVISAGTGRRGELGSGLNIEALAEPKILKDFPPDGTKVVDISAGVNHVVAILSNGKVYGWGSGRKGQIGLPAEDSWVPRLIEEVTFPASRVVCGRDFTVLVGDPSDGRISIIGSQKWGVIQNAPSCILDWQDIGASWGSVFVLLKSGNIISWGRNDHKQLHPQNLPKILQMAVGSEHVVCLAEHGEVIAWGWGEHGNCGPITDNNNDSGGSKLPISEKAMFVGAGCATSWIASEP